jgi:hypothetical protein
MRETERKEINTRKVAEETEIVRVRERERD